MNGLRPAGRTALTPIVTNIVGPPRTNIDELDQQHGLTVPEVG